jgi:hypothetical protein
MGAKRPRGAAPKPAIDLVAATATPDAFARRMAAEIAFLFGLGPVLVAGEPPPYVVAGLAAHASGVFFGGSPKKTRAARRAFEALAPAWAATLPSGIPEVACGAVVVSELPREDPEDAAERLFGAAGDGAAIVVDVPRFSPQDERRVARILEAASEPKSVVAPSYAPPDRFVRFGRRRAPFHPDAAEEFAGPAPITAIVFSRRPRLMENVLADVLVRQNLPPRRVLVLDASVDPSDAAPDDLFGLKPAPGVEVALLKKGGESLADALNDAAAAVDTPFVAFVDDAAAGFAANHFAATGAALENDADADAAFSAVVERLGDGAPRALRKPRSEDLRDRFSAVSLRDAFPWCSSVWRTEALRESGGFDPRFGEASTFDFLLRSASRPRKWIATPLPSTAVDARRRDEARRSSADDLRRAALVAIERRPLSAAAAASSGADEGERRVRALVATSLLSARANDGAAASRRAALALKERKDSGAFAAALRATRVGGEPVQVVGRNSGAPRRSALRRRTSTTRSKPRSTPGPSR